MESKNDESPYCKICSGCGEEGCCSPMNCTQSKDGKYCNSYLKDLQFGYLMYQDMYNLIKSKKKQEEIFDKNWELIYGI